MNTLKTLAVSAVLALGASAVSAATFVATVAGGPDGNDPYPLNLVYSDDVYDIDSPALYKCNVTGSLTCSDNYTSNSEAGSFSITLNVYDDDDEPETKSGSWEWSGGGLMPHYMAVKAGNAYSIYDLMGETSGFWDTSDLDNKGLSHITFYNTGVSEVPLPASALLLLGGLGGLVAMRRRRK